MMGGGAHPSIFCKRGQKTEVVWSSFVFTKYNLLFSVKGVIVRWERNSTLPPWHSDGTHDTSFPFGAIVAGAYCNFWFTSPVDLVVSWDRK